MEESVLFFSFFFFPFLVLIISTNFYGWCDDDVGDDGRLLRSAISAGRGCGGYSGHEMSPVFACIVFGAQCCSLAPSLAGFSLPF